MTTTSFSTASSSILHNSVIQLNASIGTSSFGSAPSSTVTFFSGGTPVGTTPVVPEINALTGVIGGVASLQTTELPIGTNTISARYDGDGNYLSSTSSGRAITVQADFTPSLTSNSTMASAGQPASTTINVAVEAGFTGTISFACTGLPPRSNCSFSPNTLNGGGSTNVTITTTAPTHASLLPGTHSEYFALLAGGTPLLGIFVLWFPKVRRQKTLLSIAAASLMVIGLSCGGGSSSGSGGGGNPGTPRGTYSININTSVGGFSHLNTFTLTVQ
jgi:hypothetical protein